MVSGMEDLKKRLEIILAPPTPFVDASQRERVVAEAQRIQEQREKVSQASGQLIAAALNFAGQLVTSSHDVPADPAIVSMLTSKLNECTETDVQGRPQLTITLPDQTALTQLAETLAKLLGKN
jgi:hypothetical protein